MGAGRHLRGGRVFAGNAGDREGKKRTAGSGRRRPDRRSIGSGGGRVEYRRDGLGHPHRAAGAAAAAAVPDPLGARPSAFAPRLRQARELSAGRDHAELAGGASRQLTRRGVLLRMSGPRRPVRSDRLTGGDRDPDLGRRTHQVRSTRSPRTSLSEIHRFSPPDRYSSVPARRPIGAALILSPHQIEKLYALGDGRCAAGYVAALAAATLSPLYARAAACWWFSCCSRSPRRLRRSSQPVGYRRRRRGGGPKRGGRRNSLRRVGYEAKPAYLIVLAGGAERGDGGGEMAAETVRGRDGAIDKSVATVARAVSHAQSTRCATLASLAKAVRPASLAEEVGWASRNGPRALQVLVGGSGRAEGARSIANSVLLGLPLTLLLLLPAPSAPRPALGGAGWAPCSQAAPRFPALGLLNELTTSRRRGSRRGGDSRGDGDGGRGRPAVPPRSVDAQCERSTSLHASALRSSRPALFVIPIDFVRIDRRRGRDCRSVAPPLRCSRQRQIGEAPCIGLRRCRCRGGATRLPGVPEPGPARGGARVVAISVMAIAALALPVIDSEAIGLDPGQLPAEQPAAIAGAEITAGSAPRQRPADRRRPRRAAGAALPRCDRAPRGGRRASGPDVGPTRPSRSIRSPGPRWPDSAR